MPYKDPKSPEAKASQARRHRRWYDKNGELERQRSRDAYWSDPEKERKRNRVFKEKLDAEKRCVNCAKPRDRDGKSLCSQCAPLHAASVAKYQRQVKEAAFNAYGGPVCACCGDSHFEFMSIDHIEGGGAAHRRELRRGDGQSGGGGLRLYLWLKRNNYPKGFRVLCRNCNCTFGELGYCPHERERLNATRAAVSAP